MTNPPHILAVNPWIHDFAAYDFWAKPLGLLTLAAILRMHGARVSYIDCLDRFHPKAANPNIAQFGKGHYRKEPIAKPQGLEDVERIFSRYGVQPDWFLDDLQALTNNPPDVILVTSLMTYWYTGVVETISHLRKVFPFTPIILGGVYATLCADHARFYSGADFVAEGAGEEVILQLVAGFTGANFAQTNFNPQNIDTYPYPALDLQHTITYAPLLTSRGCPFRCAYCASHILQTRRMLRAPELVTAEVLHWHTKYGVKDFALYDDAFLVGFDKHAKLILEQLISLNLPLRFHTPNALHIREITDEAAQLMFKAGFKTIRLGLETVNFEDRGIDNKVAAQEFTQAIKALLKAGFTKQDVGAYLLAGLPGQALNDVLRAIDIVGAAGITPVPAYYTPIPQTTMWSEACQISRYNLASDPLFTNNAILPCSAANFTWSDVAQIKAEVTKCSMV